MAGHMRGPIDNGRLDAVSALVRSIMPQHTVYAEPWFREGEVFFKKHPSRREVLNDPDERIVNFYTTARTRWNELMFLLEGTLHSESLSNLADNIYFGRKKMDDLYRAWAVWLRYSRDRVNRNAWLVDTSAWLAGGREESVLGGKVNKALAERLYNVLLVNHTVPDFLVETDSEETFFYIRPTDRKEAMALTDMLPVLKGKFTFYYPDKRIAENVANICGLNKVTDNTDVAVYTNFKIQKTLFDK